MNMDSRAEQIRLEPTRWWAFAHARCPHCRRGAIFARWRWFGLGELNRECPACGIRYAREAGYFLGAMYMSSAIVMAAIPLFMLVLWGLTPWSYDTILIISLLLVVPIAPLVTSLSRVLWLHFDRYFDPDEIEP